MSIADISTFKSHRSQDLFSGAVSVLLLVDPRMLNSTPMVNYPWSTHLVWGCCGLEICQFKNPRSPFSVPVVISRCLDLHLIWVSCNMSCLFEDIAAPDVLRVHGCTSLADPAYPTHLDFTVEKALLNSVICSNCPD